MTKIEIILLKNQEDYRQAYEDIYVKNIFYLGDILVTFSQRDFDHIFFEPGKEDEGYVFSERRAKRMNFIKAVLSGDIDIEIMYETDRGTIALFCIDLECVVYLRNRPGRGELQVGTFFDFGKNHIKMYLKQKKKCESITLPEIKQRYNL